MGRRPDPLMGEGFPGRVGVNLSLTIAIMGVPLDTAAMGGRVRAVAIGLRELMDLRRGEEPVAPPVRVGRFGGAAKRGQGGDRAAD
jgi:hypothetical protein